MRRGAENARRRPKALARVLSKAGAGSRTEARAWIAAGRVSVNGRVVRDPEWRVDPARDEVRLDGAALVAREPVYLVLHKPTGCLTTYRDPHGRPTVYDLITGVATYVSPVGRLDLDTSGLLIMTNDTAFADHVASPASHVPKTYLAKTSRRLTDEELDRLRQGIALADGPTRPAVVTRVRDSGPSTLFEITLTEGRNRQVRRMVQALGTKVAKLVRVKIGTVAIGTLPTGRWRRLTRAEVKALRGGPAASRAG